MSLFVTSLNSGSNGNCYYIGNQAQAILVDVGISCKEVEKRMKRLGLTIQKVKAIFISHEHSDHIRGLCTLVKKYQLPVFITPKTMLRCGFAIDEKLVNNFEPHSPVAIGDLLITGFPKLHDATDPYSFVIECGKIKVGVFTDIGATCSQLVKYFKQCHAAFLEANYDDVMLDSGTYPYHLKKRIRGGFGHLSNSQALDLFKVHRPKFMSHLFLSHLSKNNNCPDLVRKVFAAHAEEVKIVIATRYEETPVYHIQAINGVTKKTGFQANKTQLAFAFF
jgi:phosphoribosyl 1,2-cyclic phosphodiesterase